LQRESLSCPDKATALGPCAVIPREFPGFSCRFVDVELPELKGKRQRTGRRAEAAAPVIEALGANSTGGKAASWPGATACAGSATSDPGTRGTPWPHRDCASNGVYLITGGLGGIAGVLAEWLARATRRAGPVGRTPLPARADWDDWLASHPPMTRSAAASSASASWNRWARGAAGGRRRHRGRAHARGRGRTPASSFGTINGVFHTAGVIRDNLIQLKSQRDIEEVFAAKVYGTVVLDEGFRETPLDFMLLFSSTSASRGAAGPGRLCRRQRLPERLGRRPPRYGRLPGDRGQLGHLEARRHGGRRRARRPCHEPPRQLSIVPRAQQCP
jgi:phthiocerol/phenolphthiocerol synthesis type-I polyketide synthase E